MDELLTSNDASLDDGAVPDIKVMDSTINMSGNEVRKKKVLLETSTKIPFRTLLFLVWLLLAVVVKVGGGGWSKIQ